MDYDTIWVYGDNHNTNYPQYDGIATEHNIKQALINMVDIADENDIIAFITSGHGIGSAYFKAWDSGAGESSENGDFYDTELAAILDDAVAAKIFVFLDQCQSGGFGPDLMNMGNGARVYCTTACTKAGSTAEDTIHYNGYWTYYFLEYAWIDHFSGHAAISMEAIFDYAHEAYPFSDASDSEEYDGNTSVAFYMA
ncbi:MAG: caspase family protein [Candidatus Heimdallarchaeota archaeon]